MPTTSTLSSFDLTFDSTFGGVLLVPTNPTVPGCRQPGAYLTWLSPRGWMYWLFEGPINTAIQVSSRGSASQGGNTLQIQKESARLLTVRTAGLTPQHTEAVSTIYESISVYLMAPDEADVFHPILVNIDPGTFDIGNSRVYTTDLEVRILLPARRGPRR